MNCDRIARWYRWIEYLTFGSALQKRRLQYLDNVSNARNVLILGDGDGRFTTQFLKRNCAALVYSIDISPGMIRLAERRISTSQLASSRVRLFVADAMTAELPGPYDLVVTHYFLDCFTTDQAEKLVKRVAAAVCPQAKWLVSEFRIPKHGLKRWLATFIVKALYWAFRLFTGLAVTSLPNYAAALEASGFQLGLHTTGLGGLLVSELWQKTD